MTAAGVAPVIDAGAAWEGCMRRGDWQAAWRISDAVLAARAGRPRDWSAPRHLQPVWDGSPVAGRRVLVRCYHGLGDTLQFIRFVPALCAMAAEVTAWVQPPLIPLLRTMPGLGQVRLLPLHDGSPEVAYDVDIEVMELAHLFRPTPDALPGPVPYLHPPARAARRRPARGGARLAVGLVWQAGDWDPCRSVPLALLRPLADVPGVSLQVLQRGSAARAAAALGFGLAAGSDDVLEAARSMAALDLIVTVDTMTAHLAGALGLPVWTLLARPADWRWGEEERADTPWYPTMRLLRQPRPGAWAPVVQQVAEALRALAARGITAPEAGQRSPG